MTRTLTTKDAIRHLVLCDPDISVDDIADRLDELDLHVPTKFYIATFKRKLRDTMRFLRKQGMIVDKPHKLPASMRRPRKRDSNQNTDDVLPTGERDFFCNKSKPISTWKPPRKRSKPTPKRYKEFYYK
jgi:hypothetical protein